MSERLPSEAAFQAARTTFNQALLNWHWDEAMRQALAAAYAVDADAVVAARVAALTDEDLNGVSERLKLSTERPSPERLGEIRAILTDPYQCGPIYDHPCNCDALADAVAEIDYLTAERNRVTQERDAARELLVEARDEGDMKWELGTIWFDKMTAWLAAVAPPGEAPLSAVGQPPPPPPPSRPAESSSSGSGNGA